MTDLVTPEDRLRLALAQRLWSELHRSGWCDFFDDTALELGSELGVPQHIVGHTLSQLENDGLIFEKQSGLYAGIELARVYGEQHARDEWRTGNALRREILKAGIPVYEGAGPRALRFTGDASEPPMDAPFEAIAASTAILESLALVDVQRALGKSQWVVLTAAGYDVARDEAALRRLFPRTATEDENTHAAVVADVLSELITSCDQLLRERGWTAALDELARGDSRHAEHNWPDAVSEYYAAVESGLRYRLDEAGEVPSDGAALRDLARSAAEHDLIPRNYQALFTFLDSIRSPRKHGRGPRTEVVDVGPAESLLMANHARSLLVYLGHRPSETGTSSVN